MKNADIMVQCQECEMWRLVYSKYKLTTAERATLNQALEELIFTCGAVLLDLEFGEESLNGEHVFVRGLCCYKPLEKLHYSVGSYEHICIYCCSSDNISQKQDCYPQCAACGNREGGSNCYQLVISGLCDLQVFCNFTGSDVIIMTLCICVFTSGNVILQAVMSS